MKFLSSLNYTDNLPEKVEMTVLYQPFLKFAEVKNVSLIEYITNIDFFLLLLTQNNEKKNFWFVEYSF